MKLFKVKWDFREEQVGFRVYYVNRISFVEKITPAYY